MEDVDDYTRYYIFNQLSLIFIGNDSTLALSTYYKYNIISLYCTPIFLKHVCWSINNENRFQEIQRRQKWWQQKCVWNKHRAFSGRLLADSCIHRYVCSGSSCSAVVPVLQKSRSTCRYLQLRLMDRFMRDNISFT